MVASHLDRIVYVNGAYLAGRDATLSIFDRGLLFADAVYEGFGVLNGKIVDFDMHMARLERSLSELGIPSPMDRAGLREIGDRLISENAMPDGFLYLHITRGEADRDYLYDPNLKPNVFAFVQPHPENAASRTVKGVAMRSYADLRWKRRDIKSSNLLGQVMAKQAADLAGTYEALLIDDEGFITEGGATSFFIVKDQTIFLRPVTHEILHGITRQAMLKVVAEKNIATETRRFTLEEAFAADEAFITGASTYIEPVIEIDGRQIGSGEPGDFTLRLREAYFAAIE